MTSTTVSQSPNGTGDSSTPVREKLTYHTNNASFMNKELPVLLQQFQSYLSISTEKVVPKLGVSDSSQLETLAPSSDLCLKCFEIIQYANSNEIQLNTREDELLVQAVLKCFTILDRVNAGNEASNSNYSNLNKNRSHLILKLINCHKYALAFQFLYQMFININNSIHRNKLEYVQDGSTAEYVRIVTETQLPYNVFNSNSTKDVINMYLLLLKLVLADNKAASATHTTPLCSLQQLLKIFTPDLQLWFQSSTKDPAFNSNNALDTAKKLLVHFSNLCKSVWKLNYLINAIWFSQLSNDQDVIIKHFQAVLSKLLNLEPLTTYQYTKSHFHRLLDSSSALVVEKLNPCTRIYQGIKNGNQQFQQDDLSWGKFINSTGNHSSSTRNSHVSDHIPNLDTLSRIKDINPDSMTEFLTMISSNLTSLTAPKLIKILRFHLRIIKSNTEGNESLAMEILVAILSALLTNVSVVNGNSNKTFVIEYLDYVTNHLRQVAFVHDLSTRLLKFLSSLYKKFNLISRYRNLSNICFQNGGKLLTSDFQECLNQWMNCVNYEYNIFNDSKQMKDFIVFRDKIDRISNLLVEQKKYNESKIFLYKNFQCYMKISQVQLRTRDFLVLENHFNEDLEISLRLLIRVVVECKLLNLSQLNVGTGDEANVDYLKALIISGIFDKVAKFNIDGKTLMINDIMDNCKKTIKDRGLFQYLSIKYYNLILIDSFTHMNYKEFNEKQFPNDSCLVGIKDLIVCYSYLQYIVNKSFNQVILIRCVDLFHKWVSLKPNSVLNNNHLLLNLEISFMKLLLSFLQHQNLFIFQLQLLDKYLEQRASILPGSFVIRLQLLRCQTLCDFQFHKDCLLKLNLVEYNNSLQRTKLKMIEFQLNIQMKNKSKSELLFNELQVYFQNNSIPNTTRFKMIESLQLYSRFSYLSALYKSNLADHVGAIMDIRRSIRLNKVILLKHFNSITNVDMVEINVLKWQISATLIQSLKLGISLNSFRGLTKNCLYYVNELTTLIETQDSPVTKCSVYYSIAEFYLFSHDFIKSNEFMIKSDEIYNSLEFEDNISELNGLWTHAIYFQMIGDTKNEKVYYDKLEEFFKDLRNEKLNKYFHQLVSNEPQWIQNVYLNIEFNKFLKLDPTRNSDFQFHKSGLDTVKLNSITLKKNMLLAQKHLSSDAVLSGIEDSVISIPSISKDSVIEDSPTTLNVVRKLLINLDHCETLMNLAFSDENWKHLKLLELQDFSKILFKTTTLKQTISSEQKNVLVDLYNKEEICRSITFEFEKQLNQTKEDVNQLIPDMGISLFDIGHTDIFSELRRTLPDSWMVVTIDICSYNGDLLLTRIDKYLEEPVAVRLPLTRLSTRDLDESMMTFNDAMRRLREIIDKSNATTKMDRISQIKSRADKLLWWDERQKLDQELSDLFQTIETHWIGGFRGIFNQSRVNENLKKNFKHNIDIILNQYLPSRFNKKWKNPTKIQIHDKILELFFLNLSTPLESPDHLEDLIYFVLDTLLFHGEENSVDEIDVDHMYVDIEELLNKYHSDNVLREFLRFDHTVLIPGKSCCNFPWESLPFLRQYSITRLPSLAMLNDLLIRNRENNYELKIEKGYYIVNPNNDLSKTELNFKTQFTENESWHGVIGMKPTEEQFGRLLTEYDLLVYIGHGSGDQYIRSSTIKSFDRCSPSLLIGCSSGVLHENGLLEPYGPVYNHLMAGSPLCLVNLWDVTDKDIDRFTLSVFEKWGLFEERGLRNGRKSISVLVASSRDQCHLKYLNGAAPVVYGLPFKLK